jgi:hypothetical protein
VVRRGRVRWRRDVIYGVAVVVLVNAPHWRMGWFATAGLLVLSVLALAAVDRWVQPLYDAYLSPRDVLNGETYERVPYVWRVTLALASFLLTCALLAWLAWVAGTAAWEAWS